MRLALLILAAGLACLPGLAQAQAAASPESLDSAPEHANPVMLNEYAVRLAMRGDLSTAELLLTRAALLAPHDWRIARNLEAVRRARQPAPRPQGQRVDAAPAVSAREGKEDQACDEPACALPAQGPWPLQ